MALHIRPRLCAQVFALVAACAMAGCADPAPVQPDKGVGADKNWTAPQGSADESGYSQLDQIDPDNIERLGLVWSMDLPDEVTLEGTPLAIDGTLYFSGGYGEVYCVDGVTGALKWKYDPETWKRGTDRFNFGSNRGVAYEDGRVFTAGMDGRLDALDADWRGALRHSPAGVFSYADCQGCHSPGDPEEALHAVYQASLPPETLAGSIASFARGLRSRDLNRSTA